MLNTWITKWKARSELMQVFNAGQVYLSKRNTGGKEIRRYPKIHEVNVQSEFTRYVFTLPNGLDPKDVAKKEYVFKQVLGSNIELKGEVKKYELTIYKSSMPTSFKYNYDLIGNDIKSFRVPIYCGVDRNGQYIYYDMAKIPHLLIGGRTGWGKSTQLRQLLTTLILSRSPEQLELYLGDCKKAEFHVFRNLAHVKANVVRAGDIRKMLKYLKSEMDRRSDLTDVFGVSHIDDLPADQKFPYLVLCIDEFVMLRKENDIMESLIDLTAMGRALGILCILSMQRPVSTVIDTTARSNLNVAMGFSVRDAIESRVLCTPGAEKISVKGRFYMDINGDMSEIQAPFLELEKAKKLLEPFKVAPQEAKEIFNDAPSTNDVKELTYHDVFGDDKE
ncbi:FtsK/SpoIIIE domain-containing protein [Metabacillus fastidiosus]|uniref:FtsK/SpoIIIE domain-containing protein n=1 Tax=Metabacillus fastidiosus TaxID=1458 RepID=UPI003D288FA7